LTRLQEKFTKTAERADRLVKDLSSRMVKPDVDGVPNKTMSVRMHHHSSVTGHSLDGSNSNGSDNDVDSNSDGSDHDVNAEAGRAALKAAEGTRKRLLGGKRVPQLLEEAWGGGRLTMTGRDDETGSFGG
jgi:hypothetical protein